MADIRWDRTDQSYPPKKEEEEKGFLSEGMSPLTMGLLQAGASMMRQSGWRRTPITTSEQIGYAIPAGIQGYYNQKVMNQQEEAQRIAEEQARQEQENLLLQQQQEQVQIQQASDQLDLIPNSLIRLSTKKALKWQLQQGGKSAQDAMNKIIELTSAQSTLKPEWKKVEITDKEGNVKTQWFDLNAKGANLEILTKNAPDRITKEQLQGIADSIKESYPTFHDKAKIILQEPNLSIAHQEMRDLVKELPQIPKEISPEDYGKKADSIYKLFKGKKYLDEGALDHLESINSASATEKSRYEALHEFAKHWGGESYKKIIAEDKLDLDYEKFELSEEKFRKETEHWNVENTQRLMQQAIENGWNKKKIQREIVMHNARLGQMAKAQEDGTKYLEKEEFEKQFGKMPAGAFVAEIKDGEVVKFKKEDFSDLIPPQYSDEDMKVLNEELNALYKDYPTVFGEKEQRGIATTISHLQKSGGDPADALKEAHDILTAERKTITPPASILKKYQSDIAVIKNAEEALELLKDETQSAEDIKKGVGFFWGRVTEKFKNEQYQKFKALATMASLTKRHELIGSQMTDGELRFTESLFPSPQDTLTSVRTKLETLIADAKYNVSITKNMFTEEAGYNPNVFNITPRYSNGKITFEGGGTGKGETIYKKDGSVDQDAMLDNYQGDK